MPNLDLKKKIMRRVYTVWFLRKATSPLVLEIFAFAAILFVLFSFYISLFDVMRNAFGGYSSLSALSVYFFRSFMVADLISQVLILGAMATFVLFNWEIIKNQFKTA